jgi:hypothetical protein
MRQLRASEGLEERQRGKNTTEDPAPPGGHVPPVRRGRVRCGETFPDRRSRPYTAPNSMPDTRIMESPTSNLAPWDRALRLLCGLILVALPTTGVVSGRAAMACWLFAWIPLLTATIRWCPIYSLLGFSTRRH